MSEINTKKHHWLTKLSVIGISSIIGAFGSGFLSLYILIFLWGGDDSALQGVWGFPIGFLVGGGMAIWLLSKQLPIWKPIVYSILWAFLASCLFIVAVYAFSSVASFFG